MTHTPRRDFLKLLGTGAMTMALPDSIQRALALPANHRSGSIDDVEHIIFLMQENRSFDHYFGTLRGVRGFGDPHPVRLPNGNTVWQQPGGTGQVMPYRPDAASVGMEFLPDPPHGWTDSHAAWNAGKYDQWVPSKGQSAMTTLMRRDIPYHYALADAFTVCDAYYCSLLGPTDPNRYHMWTGWVGNDGRGGGPVITNAELGYDWHTYPERLQAAGISWKVYQDVGVGLTAAGYWGWTDDAYIGNYGDNSLLYFHQYQNALPGSPLADHARTGTEISARGTLFDIFRADVGTGRLPQVSWIVAPEAYSEHPNWPANYGAWYISQILDALTARPDVWAKTVLFLTYDENGGYFDHLVPPTPPQTRAQGLSTVATTNEIFPGDGAHPAGPYGFGIRVPMIVISPWSKGGWVNSQVFDHTSLIRFLEARFARGNPALVESNITPWRRAVAGDLTSAFNFKRPNDAVVPLPGTAAYLPPDRLRHPDDDPQPPANQALPKQEPGLRRARALPYELSADGALDAAGDAFRIAFGNTGDATAVFHVRSGRAADAPRSYTVEPGKTLTDSWALQGGACDLSVHGPNGFYRSFKLTSGRNKGKLAVTAVHDAAGNGLIVTVTNQSAATDTVKIVNRYGGEDAERRLAPRESWTRRVPLRGQMGWYDIAITVDDDPGLRAVLAGHVENGDDSIADPRLGGMRLKSDDAATPAQFAGLLD